MPSARALTLLILALPSCTPSIGIDLARDREGFIRRLALSGSPAELEVLRQHLYDGDPEIARLARELLASLKDEATVLERHVLENLPAADEARAYREKLKRFIESIPGLDLLRATALHAVTHAYRPGIDEIDFSEIWKKLTIEDLESRRFDVKSGTMTAQTGILTEDGLAFRPGGSVRSSEGVVMFSPRKEDSAREDRLIPDRPLEGGWVRAFPRLASRPLVHEGRFFMGDGRGHLISGSLKDGSLDWAVPFPVPPGADLAFEKGLILVRMPARAQEVLTCRFDAATGAWCWAELSPQTPARTSRWTSGETSLEVTGAPGGFKITCRAGERALWSRDVECDVDDAARVGDRWLILGRWTSGSAALAALDSKSGTATWSIPIEGGGDQFRFAARDPEWVWILSNESFVAAVDPATGMQALGLQVSGTLHTSPLTAFDYDPSTDRFLIDPSNGFLYSVPRAGFLGTQAYPAPRDRRMPFEEAFGLEPVVGRLDRPVTEESLFGQFANRFGESRFTRVSTDKW
ncbi:MAG TPA: PQQ-binding-like beta-propeller repeat protein, partial [Planctomycetota bacterium]|nr:PQQ-binding-like beta-propeller repeat protein [Planctomycetota bacterium]